MLGTFNNKTAIERMGDFGVYTPADFDAYVKNRKLQDIRFAGGIAERPCIYVLRLQATGELIGGVSVAQRVVSIGSAAGPGSDTDGTATAAQKVVLPPDIGWALLEPHMGQGYATESAAALAQHVRNIYRSPMGLMVFLNESNRQSNRVAEKLGFVDGSQCERLDSPGGVVSMWILPGMERIDTKLQNGISFALKR